MFSITQSQNYFEAFALQLYKCKYLILKVSKNALPNGFVTTFATYRVETVRK